MDFLTKIALGVSKFFAETGDVTPEDDASSFIEKLTEFLYSGTVVGIIAGGLGLFLIIKGALIGAKVIKAADDASQRKEALDSLKYLVIGVFLTLALYFGAGAIVGIFFDGGIFGTGKSSSSSSAFIAPIINLIK